MSVLSASNHARARALRAHRCPANTGATRPEIMDNVRCQFYREVVTVSSTTRRTNRADPLGPDSLTWKYFGDLRTGMMGVWIGALQNMYPELGAGVEEHSILLREPLQRVARSVYPIMGVVYDGDRAAQTGQQIKGFHTTIKGVDADGTALSRAESRDVLLGARHLLHAGDQGRRLLLRRADRGREAPALRRACAVVRAVRHEHAAGARVVGGVLRVLGPGVQRGTRDQPRHAATSSRSGSPNRGSC